ncbi:MAG: TonB-dependent receptor [Xanthomonadales bacterium PRO6]|nr:Pesticin receptor [Xanthomonadales bacterium]MCE7932210.1 TonB-dependent receptor [Xanthomonadales bacterium PRO6]
MSTITQRCLLTSAILLALASTPLSAQEATTSADEATESTELEAVTVTAQSRSQSVQEVPISVSVIDDVQVERLAATDMSQIANYLPGLVVDAWDQTQPSFALRGIRTDTFSIGIDSAVGIYVNGVYQTNGGGSLLAFNDIQRVEVLKGPQGTLFGRNTAAGAISIVSNEPGLDFEARGRVRVGSENRRYSDALVNLPVGERFGLRMSAINNRDDGWQQDTGTGRRYEVDRQFGARAAFGGDLTETWNLQLAWDHERIKQPQRLGISALPFLNNSTARAPFPPDPASYRDPRDVDIYQDVVDGKQLKGYDGASLKLTGSFDWGTLTSVTAFSESDIAHNEDQDGTNNPTVRLDSGVTQSGSTRYQEFKFAGANDSIDWVAGLSWYREEGEQSNIVNSTTNAIDTLFFNQGAQLPCGGPLACIDLLLAANGFPQRFLGHDYGERINNEMRSTSTAVFGDVIWHVTDRINLTGGLRYTRDDKEFAWFNPLRVSPGIDATLRDIAPFGLLSQIPPQLLFLLRNNLVFANAVGVEVERENDWSDVSPRVVLDFRVADDSMLYLSASEGYKAGGFDGVQIDSEYAPENVRNYELGIKNSFPSLRMVLNAAVYRYDYTDRQSLLLVPASSPAGIPQYLVQSFDQSAEGFDVEWSWRATDDLSFNLAAAYIDSTFDNGSTTAGGEDLSGQPTGEPEWSFAAGANYVWRLGENGELEFNLQHSYRGETRCNADSEFQGLCGEYTGFQVGDELHLTNVRVGWTSPDYRWGAALYVNNVFDEQNVRSIGGQAQSVLGTPIGTLTLPRMWGFELSARWD